MQTFSVLLHGPYVISSFFQSGASQLESSSQEPSSHQFPAETEDAMRRVEKMEKIFIVLIVKSGENPLSARELIKTFLVLIDNDLRSKILYKEIWGDVAPSSPRRANEVVRLCRTPKEQTHIEETCQFN
jgi:hypothetical protein